MWGIQTLTSDVMSEHNGKVLLVVDIVGVEMQKHLGTSDCGDAGADYTLDMRQSLEQLGPLGAASSRGN